MSIKQIRIRPHSEAWHQFRYESGFGGSEISSVVATRSKTIADLCYTTPLKLFLLKVGEQILDFQGNIASMSGLYMEKIIMEFYKHYDLDNSGDLTAAQMEMFRNIEQKKRINKVIQPKTYYVNSKWPWLFCSPDAKARKNFSGTWRLLEAKNSTSMTAKKYTNGIDPQYYLQCQHNLLVTEMEVADLCLLLDGRYFSCVTIEPNKEIHDMIIESSHDMWQRILAARKIKEEYNMPVFFGLNPEVLTEKEKEAAQMLAELEPEIVGTDKEVEFIKSMIIPSETDNPMEGNSRQEELCQQYLAIKNQKDDLEIKTKEVYIELIRALEGHNRADFASGGFYTYKADKNNRRSIYVSPKILPSNQL